MHQKTVKYRNPFTPRHPPPTPPPPQSRSAAHYYSTDNLLIGKSTWSCIVPNPLRQRCTPLCQIILNGGRASTPFVARSTRSSSCSGTRSPAVWASSGTSVLLHIGGGLAIATRPPPRYSSSGFVRTDFGSNFDPDSMQAGSPRSAASQLVGASGSGFWGLHILLRSVICQLSAGQKA